MSISAIGDTLAVGAVGESSSSTGVNGDQGDNSAEGSGAVYVFTRNENDWTEQAYVKASNTTNNNNFGTSVSLSASGDTLAVGAKGEGGDSTGINGDQSVGRGTWDAGAVYLYILDQGDWAQEAYIKATHHVTFYYDPDIGGEYEEFGSSVSLAGDGNMLAVGAPLEGSDTPRGGAVFLY